MRTLFQTLPLIALLSACGSLQETASVRDDVYDVPDRTVMASKSAAAPAPEAPATSEEDYYDAGESRSVQSDRRDFYDMTYNDPYWYNYGRFGWNNPYAWGPSVGIGYGTGWMGNGWSVGMGYGFGNPYWGNSWMSGYGAWGGPWGGGWGYGYPYYGMGNPYYGYGYGGGWGGPYQGPWGGCYGCYEPVGYGNGAVYGHRPSLNGGSGNGTAGTGGNPRGYRNPAGLVDTRPTVGRQESFEQRVRTNTDSRNMRTQTPMGRPSRDNGFSRPARTPRPATRETTPSRTFDGGGSRGGGGGSSPSRGGGGSGGGGGRTTSPRPR